MGDFIISFREHTDWLYTMIYENRFFFFDYWSLVHLWSGLIIFILLAAIKLKRKWLILFVLLLLYELAEIAFLYIALDIFKPETFKDQITDIVVGLIGGWIGCQVIKKKFERTYIATGFQKFLIFFSSFTLAFLWVGNYHYHYNVTSLNTPGINLWAFFLWCVGGYIIIELYLTIKRRVNNKIGQLIILWLIYFVSLLVIEFIGYYCVEIQERSISYDNPLIFGLIHGSFWLHLYYMTSPFLLVAFYETLSLILGFTKVETNQVEITKNENIIEK